MKKVFVSGCYDILHAGHIQFFEDARALGDHLTVCFASDKVLKLAKGRKPSMPEDNKMIILRSLKCVDEVVKSSDLHPTFDFVSHLKKSRPNILAVTEDDKHIEEKKVFCAKEGITLVVLPKRSRATRTSTTSILAAVKNIVSVPLRVDFAGGWLDVPKFARKGGHIVNCAITPKVSLDDWPYEKSGGLGGSAAYAILKVKSGVESELNLGVGWQDPAVIEETGLCVWRSGRIPVLEFKSNPDWLQGKMLIVWMNKDHVTPNLVDLKRDYDLIFRAGEIASRAVRECDLKKLCSAVSMSYRAEIDEGMDPLPKLPGEKAKKYLGGGHGGYALYIFASPGSREKAARGCKFKTKKIEPYIFSRV